jgi:hypothetical protein
MKTTKLNKKTWLDWKKNIVITAQTAMTGLFYRVPKTPEVDKMINLSDNVILQIYILFSRYRNWERNTTLNEFKLKHDCYQADVIWKIERVLTKYSALSSEFEIIDSANKGNNIYDTA